MINLLKRLFFNTDGKSQQKQETVVKFNVSGSASGNINSDLVVRCLVVIITGGLIVNPVLKTLDKNNLPIEDSSQGKLTIVQEAEKEKHLPAR